VGASSLLIVAAGAASIHLQPWPIAGIPSLELAARCCLAPALALLALIFRVSTYRFVSVQDIDAAAGKAPQSDKVQAHCNAACLKGSRCCMGPGVDGRLHVCCWACSAINSSGHSVVFTWVVCRPCSCIHILLVTSVKQAPLS
jgi:hypothetical protein